MSNFINELHDLEDIDCYLFYVQDLLGNKEEIIGDEVIAQIKTFGDSFYEIAKKLEDEQSKRSKQSFYPGAAKGTPR